MQNDRKETTTKHYVAVGDAFVTPEHFDRACERLRAEGCEVDVIHWGPEDRQHLEHLIRMMEMGGPDAIDPPFEVAAIVRAGSGLLVDFCPVPRSLIDKASIIGVCRSGLNNIDVAAARSRGVPLVNTVGRNANAVAEFTVGSILAESRNIARTHTHLASGRWVKDFATEPTEIRGKTIGLVGFGTIARLVAEKLSTWKCDFVYYDPKLDGPVEGFEYVQPTDLHDLLRTSDFVSIHARYAPDTHGLIGSDELKLMKRSAYLINTARSGLVDERALVQILEAGQIRGAALDVFEEEPLNREHPFVRMSNVTLTPHLAGATQESLRESPHMLISNLLDYLQRYRR